MSKGLTVCWWRRYVPAYARNPLRLALRLVKTRNPAAISAIVMAAVGLLFAPLDLLLRRKERQIYAAAPDCKLPVIIVIGPPRSGTTLVAQYLINSLEVCYLNNLTSLFPRSPIMANRLFGSLAPLSKGEYSFFYGKSRRLSGVNDGLYIWDRWLGSDRSIFPEQLRPESERTLPAFFGALQELYGLPVVNKVNRLNGCANLVAAVLSNAFFVCLHRDPVYLAQSLLAARREILGDLNEPYGTKHSETTKEDPVEDVCRQVAFHLEHANRQQTEIGEDRFVIVSYEEFCEKPASLARYLAQHLPGIDIVAQPMEPSGGKFRISRSRKSPEDEIERLKHRLAELAPSYVNLLKL